MGSLAAAYTIRGFGKGLEAEHKEKADIKSAEISETKRTARETQLQRMRDNADQERQRQSDKAAADRESTRYGPGGYAQVAADHAANIAEMSATKGHARNIEIETMRQEAETARDRMKIDEKNPRFDFTQTKAAQSFDQLGNIVTTQAATTVTDRVTNVTYKQVGTAFVPQGWDPPSDTMLKAGQKAAETWLLNPKFAKNQQANSLKFLESFGFLPSGYFSKFGGYDPNKRTITRGSDTETKPANPLTPGQ